MMVITEYGREKVPNPYRDQLLMSYFFILGSPEFSVKIFVENCKRHTLILSSGTLLIIQMVIRT